MEAIQLQEPQGLQSSSKTAPGFTLSEEAFYKIQIINSQIRLLRELSARAPGENLTITASALEETLALMEEILEKAINNALFKSP